MTRSELITKISEHNPNLSLAEVDRVVNLVFDEITRALKKHERVELRGFGAFTVKQRDPREGRNPKTGEKVKVAAKAVPFFKSGKSLLDRLNT